MQTVGACACALKVVVVEIKMRIRRSFGEWRNDNNCSYHREQSSIHYYIIHRSLGRVVPWSAPLDSTRRRRFTVVSLLCCGVSRYGRTTPDHNKSPSLPVPSRPDLVVRVYASWCNKSPTNLHPRSNTQFFYLFNFIPNNKKKKKNKVVALWLW